MPAVAKAEEAIVQPIAAKITSPKTEDILAKGTGKTAGFFFSILKLFNMCCHVIGLM